MKHTLFLLHILILTLAQAQSSDWLISSGGKHADCGSALAVTNAGEIILTGSFQGEAHFGNQKLYSNGDTDVFLAKYSKNGELKWLKQAGSNVTKRNTITEYPTAVKVNDNAIYLTGVFAGIAEFDDAKITSQGREDVFIAKYDLKGTLIWVKRAGGSSQDVSYDLEVDTEGNIYITGFFQKNAGFGSYNLEATNNREFFLAKYSSEGDVQWVQQSNGQSFSQGKALSIDDQNIVVAGEFADETNFDGFNISSEGASDAFIAKYNLAGELLWIKRHGSQGMDNVSDLVLKNDDIYISGSYLTNQSEEHWRSKGGRDGFVSKLSKLGSLVWNQTYGGTENDEVTTLEITNNTLLIGGKYNNDFEFNEETYLSNGFTDMYILKVDLDGKLEDIKVMGGIGQDFPTKIIADENRFFLTGLFRNQLTSTTDAAGGSDIFLSGHDIDFNHHNETKVTYLVYPNPTESDFWIRGDEEFNEIELIREDGRIIQHKKELQTMEYRFELSDLPSGIYYVRIDGSSVKKIIIL